jgi:calpain
MEWNGPWSDKSSEWSHIPENTKKEIGLNFDNDGEFWMSYRDFVKHFDHIEICNLSPNSLTDDIKRNGTKKWTLNVYEGEWIAGISAGGCNDRDKFYRNPQYIVHLESPDQDCEDGKCSVVIALMQKNRRNKKRIGLDFLIIGFKIFKLSESDLKQKPLKTDFFKYNDSIKQTTFINLREVCLRLKLPPGNYLIVPSTFDVDEEGEFLIRVFSESKNTIVENDDTVGVGDVDSRVCVVWLNNFEIFFKCFLGH